jgi:hypothetical protein
MASQEAQRLLTALSLLLTPAYPFFVFERAIPLYDVVDLISDLMDVAQIEAPICDDVIFSCITSSSVKPQSRPLPPKAAQLPPKPL